MTKTIDPTTQAQLESSTPKPFRLFEFYLDSGTRYYTDTDRKVLWSENFYDPIPIAVGDVKRSATGFVEQVSLSVAGADRVFAGLVMSETFRGRPLTIRRAVFDATGYVVLPVIEVFSGLMDEITGAIEKDTSNVHLTAKTYLEYWQAPLPKRSYQVGCDWAGRGRFKGVECKYAGAATTCDGTWAQCKSYGNQANYGGFRHLPQIEGTPLYWGRVAPGITPVKITF